MIENPRKLPKMLRGGGGDGGVVCQYLLNLVASFSNEFRKL